MSEMFVSYVQSMQAFCDQARQAGRQMAQLRRLAKRQGYRFKMGRQLAMPDFKLYAVIDLETGRPVNPPLAGSWEHSWTLSEVATFLLTAHGPCHRHVH